MKPKIKFCQKTNFAEKKVLLKKKFSPKIILTEKKFPKSLFYEKNLLKKRKFSWNLGQFFAKNFAKKNLQKKNLVKKTFRWNIFGKKKSCKKNHQKSWVEIQLMHNLLIWNQAFRLNSQKQDNPRGLWLGWNWLNMK